MNDAACVLPIVISVTIEERDDGGLRVHSPDVPGLHLSGPAPDVVMRDVIPAIKTLFRYNRNVDVEVRPVDQSVADAPSHIEDDPNHAVIAAFATDRFAVSHARH